MTIWVDAQLSPAIARWLRERFDVDAHAVRDVGLRDASDVEIFNAARAASANVMTKDADFAFLVAREGPPPQILWIRSGNTSNARLKEILELQWEKVAALLDAGEALVELADPVP